MNGLNPFTSLANLELPETFKSVKYGLKNIQNTDIKSLQYCVARHFCRDEKHNYRVTKRVTTQIDKLNWNGIKFSMELNNIDLFIQNNKIRINVYSFINRFDQYSLRISQVKFQIYINLLIFAHEKKIIFTHPENKRETYTCHYCLQVFSNKTNLLSMNKSVLFTHQVK